MSTQRNDTLLDDVRQVLPENIYINSRVIALALYRKKKAKAIYYGYIRRGIALIAD